MKKIFDEIAALYGIKTNNESGCTVVDEKNIRKEATTHDALRVFGLESLSDPGLVENNNWVSKVKQPIFQLNSFGWKVIFPQDEFCEEPCEDLRGVA